jgi:hypothetical protein
MGVRTAACVLLFTFAAGAQAPSAPPQILRIIRQVLKPGKAAASDKAGTGMARAAARFKYPANFLALSAVSGEPEVWIIESHDSFVSIENTDAFVEKSPPLKWWLSQSETPDSEALASVRRLLAVYRQDLSYHGPELAQNLPKMRYMSVVMVRLHPARDADFAEAVKFVTAAYEKTSAGPPLVIYQVVSGAQGPTYLFFSPMASLKTMDEAPARGKAIREAMGEENAAKMLKTSAEVTEASQSFLFELNPRLSYVSKEFAAVDPDFWIPKPPRPATPPAPAPGVPPPAPGATPPPK